MKKIKRNNILNETLKIQDIILELYLKEKQKMLKKIKN